MNVDTGKYVWHYQMVPNEQWDFTCTQPIVLADMKIDGKHASGADAGAEERLLLCARSQDRQGDLRQELRAESVGLGSRSEDRRADRESGVVSHRRAEADDADDARGAYVASDVVQPDHGARVSLRAGAVGGDVPREGLRTSSGCRSARTAVSTTPTGPRSARSCRTIADSREKGYLLAWDPVHQKEAFRVNYPYPGSGGILSTAGNILVQGTVNKTLAVYRADNGAKLWEMDTQTVAIAGPMTYELDGEQYIAVNFGWGGSPVHGIDCRADARALRPGASDGVQARRDGREPAADAAAVSDPAAAAAARFGRVRSARARSCSARPARAVTARTLAAA